MSTKEKNLEEEDSEEVILNEKNFQEKIKNLPKSYRKNWLWVSMEKHGKSWIWVSIGIVIVYYFSIWYYFFIGISSLFNTIFYTISPLMVFFIYRGRIKKKERKERNKGMK